MDCKEVDELTHHYFSDLLGPYWSPVIEKYVKPNYTTLPFPFKTLDEIPSIQIEQEWDADGFIGYLSSVSAAKKFHEEKGYHAIDDIRTKMKEVWGTQSRQVIQKIYMKVGRKQ